VKDLEEFILDCPEQREFETHTEERRTDRVGYMKTEAEFGVMRPE
jgi:hypothetical protein